jgi:crotonobetainyl-CoA:carnitine CoA-transferase CaiB-like acyl-CoA transferase
VTGGFLNTAALREGPPRVLELGEGPAVAFAARMFVQLGADVIKVEALPEGDPARRGEPTYQAEGACSAYGVAFHYLNSGKRSIGLDFDDPSTPDLLDDLLAWSEVVLIDEKFASLRGVRDAVELADLAVRTFITPFGSTGPYADYAALPGAVFALGGELAMLPGGLGYKAFPDAPPLLPRGNLPDFDGGLIGALVSLAAMYHESSRQQCNDVASLEANASLNRWLISHYDESGWIETRGTRSYPYAGMFECADGYVMLQPSTEAHWTHLVEMMGNPEWALKPEYATRAQRSEAGTTLSAKLSQWLKTRTKQEILLGGLAHAIPAAPFRNAAEVLGCEQFNARQFFVPYGDEDGAEDVAPRVPGLPFQLAPFGAPCRRRAPDLGEHTQAILAMLSERSRIDGWRPGD